MTKIAGSGSISQRHGSADPDPDPDPHQKCHGSATLMEPVPGMYRMNLKGKMTLATSGMEVNVFSRRMAASRSLFCDLDQ
jgi:hypothetical protein